MQAPDARPYGTPGTGALWLSILGFCGVTAILGVIFGFAARNEAKRRGVSPAKAYWAIAIGLFWLLPVVIALIGMVVAQPKTATVPAPTRAPVTAASAETVAPQTFANDVEAELVRLKFVCDGSKGFEKWVQCRKGSYTDPTYGPSPLETVNIWANYENNGSQYVEGFVKPGTYKALKSVAGKWSYSGDAVNGTRSVTGSPASS